MKTPPTDHRSAHAARAALEAQRAARMQDTARAETSRTPGGFRRRRRTGSTRSWSGRAPAENGVTQGTTLSAARRTQHGRRHRRTVPDDTWPVLQLGVS